MNIPKELQDLRASIEILTNKYKEVKATKKVKADGIEMEKEDDCCKCLCDELENTLFQLVNYIHSRISYLENSFYAYEYEHSEGHLPKIKTASDMKRALDVLGLADDYEVKKQVIYANDKYGFIF